MALVALVKINHSRFKIIYFILIVGRLQIKQPLFSNPVTSSKVDKTNYVVLQKRFYWNILIKHYCYFNKSMAANLISSSQHTLCSYRYFNLNSSFFHLSYYNMLKWNSEVFSFLCRSLVNCFLSVDRYFCYLTCLFNFR